MAGEIITVAGASPVGLPEIKEKITILKIDLITRYPSNTLYFKIN
jgi:hypothetical protein